MTGEDVFLYALGRTPFGKFHGQLAGYSPAELGARAIDELLTRSALPPDSIDRIFVGVAMLGGASLTVARQIVLGSRLPDATPSLGVDRACCSGVSAIALAASHLRAGEMRLAMAGGVEVLSRTPRLLGRQQFRSGDLVLEDPLILRVPFAEGSISGYTSEEALKVGVSRSAQDTWAMESHARYFRAEKENFFSFERFGVAARPASGASAADMLAADESPREHVDARALAALPTVRGSATITAGNAPGLSDGAAFVLLGNSDAARAFDLQPIARIVATTSVAEGPTSGTRTPALSILKLLDRQGLDVAAIDVIEINEAFAATPLVSTLVLADFDAAAAERLRRRTNPNGGAVAIGHPMGASGARIVMTMIAELRRRGGGLGVAAICGGFGQGEAMLVRV